MLDYVIGFLGDFLDYSSGLMRATYIYLLDLVFLASHALYTPSFNGLLIWYPPSCKCNRGQEPCERPTQLPIKRIKSQLRISTCFKRPSLGHCQPLLYDTFTTISSYARMTEVTRASVRKANLEHLERDQRREEEGWRLGEVRVSLPHVPGILQPLLLRTNFPNSLPLSRQYRQSIMTWTA